MKRRLEEEEARAIERIKAAERERKMREEQADLKNSKLVDECVTTYTRSVQSSLDVPNKIFNHLELEQIYTNAKRDAASMVLF